MKKLSLLTLAAAGLLMVGCSDKDTVVDNTAQNLEEFENGGYIGISLSLPSADETVTRAGDVGGNDQLSNGIKEEFAVKNATLYIFKGTSEENAKFVDYVALGVKYEKDDQPGINEEGVTSPDNQADEWAVQEPTIDTKITSTSLNEATKISNELAKAIRADNTNNYYAYVILNHNGQVPTLTKNSTTFADFSKAEFSEIGADIAAEQNIYESGLLMTNAPICNVGGGTDSPNTNATNAEKTLTYSTLVPLDKSKIFGSAAQAKKEPAACVYVERAAVKITVEEGGNLNTTLYDYTIDVLGWQVINNEPTYFNTRQINFDGSDSEDWGPFFNEDATKASTKYRFVSQYMFEPTLPAGLTPQTGKTAYEHTIGYRTYFAADPHYATNPNQGNPTDDGYYVLANTVASDARPWIGAGEHAYTTENTFDVVHQTWRNTTMVTIKTQLKKANGDPADGFYTVGNGGQTLYDNVADVEAALHNIILADPTVANKVQTALNLLSTNRPNKNIQCVLTVTLTPATAAKTGVDFNCSVNWTEDGNALSTLSDATKAEAETTAKGDVTNAIDEFIQEEVNGENVYTDPVLVSYYKDGYSYYNVRIQHFGEKETPWNSTGSYISGGGVNVNEIYGVGANPDKSKERFLGRYGVVRDNWYKLSIDGITKVGSATPIDPSKTTPDTPDDEIENYISVHVHIVPWVLRSQSVIL